MNENLYVSNHGLRLITQFEGAPRLKARLCEGGRYELSYGVTFHLDGRPVEAEETCTEDYAMAMFRNALGQFEEVVKRHVTIELTQYQFDALVAFAYNVGEANFASSTVLRETNARRFEDAAAAFGMWVFATRDGYKQALRGLLRRRYAEAATYMGYHYHPATDDEAIALQKIPPPGDPPKGSDKVTYKTPFLEVLRVAQHYPLAPDTQEPVEAKPAPAPIQDSAKPLPQPAVPSAADTNGSQPSPATQPATAGLPPVSKPQLNPTPAKVEVSASAAAPPEHPVPRVTDKPPLAAPVIAGQGDTKPIHRETKMPEGIPYGIDPTVGAKPMETTERFIGSAMLWLANGLRVGMANGMKVSGAGGFLVVLFLDMMKSPVTSALILSTIIAAICAVGWLCGVVLEKAGLRKKKKGERAASQLMY